MYYLILFCARNKILICACICYYVSSKFWVLLTRTSLVHCVFFIYIVFFNVTVCRWMLWHILLFQYKQVLLSFPHLHYCWSAFSLVSIVYFHSLWSICAVVLFDFECTFIFKVPVDHHAGIEDQYNKVYSEIFCVIKINSIQTIDIDAPLSTFVYFFLCLHAKLNNVKLAGLF